MNVIISAPDACGKTTLGEKLLKKYGMKEIIHSTSFTPNTLEYHLDLITYHDNTVFDRFSVGELIFPYMYGREPKLTKEEFDIVMRRVMDNGDIYIMMLCSDPEIIKKRLIERGEEKNIVEVEEQLRRYTEVAEYMKTFNYKYFYVCDIAQPDGYDRLDDWIEVNFNRVSVNRAYRDVCKDLLEKGHVMETRNVRGGTKELCNYSFVINDLDSEIVSLKNGNSNLTYLAAELLWYWSARNDTAFIGKFAKLWNKLSDDGVTNNSAYGYILQKKHGFNQIEKVIELLTVDPYSRRAVININVPNEKVIETKDEPCTIGLVYQIRGGRLYCTCIMRSNDINFGFRNDVGFFVYLQKYIARRLGVGVGSYTHFAASLHFYDRDEAFVKKVAYSSLESMDERLNIDKLIEKKDLFIDWVDNHFTNKEDFTELLKKEGVIY